MRARWAAGATILFMLIGQTTFVLGTPPYDSPTDAFSDGDENHGSVVVIAIIDSGINPYHVAYRDDTPLGQTYPGEYIEGYPPNVPALNLTLDASSVVEALNADCESVWAQVEAGQMYWIPGTRITGAVFWPHSTDVRPDALIDLMGEDRSWEVDCERSVPRIPPIVTTGGHGNMVSSRIVGEGFGLCSDIQCRLVVVNAVNQAGLDFVADNTHWIDLQTNQWFSVVTTATPASGAAMDLHGAEVLALSPEIVRTIEETAQRHLSLWSTGNTLPLSTLNDGRLTPSVVMVGGHDNGRPLPPHFASTPAHIVGDVCANWAATPHALEGYSKVGSGTSSAAPYAAGGAAKILLEARRILDHHDAGIHDGISATGTPPPGITSGPLADGTFTLEEWSSLLLASATARPESQYADGDRCDEPFAFAYDMLGGPGWSELPDEYPAHLEIGYGAIDERSIELARGILLAQSDMPERGEEDDYFAVDRTHREMQYLLNTGSE